MNHFNDIAGSARTVCMLAARHNLSIAFHGNALAGQALRGDQFGDGAGFGHAQRFTVVTNLHAQLLRIRFQASHSQPAMKASPPIGVMAPNQRGAPSAMA